MHGMQEVGGSIPPGSTSLRSLRELRLGKPRSVLSQRSERRLFRRSPQGEGGPENGLPLPSIQLRELRLGKPRSVLSQRSERRLSRRSLEGVGERSVPIPSMTIPRRDSCHGRPPAPRLASLTQDDAIAASSHQEMGMNTPRKFTAVGRNQSRLDAAPGYVEPPLR